MVKLPSSQSSYSEVIRKGTAACIGRLAGFQVRGFVEELGDSLGNSAAYLAKRFNLRE